MKTPIIWILIFLLTFFTHSKTRHTGKFSIIRDFLIAQSRSGEVATRVLPDASICDDCIDDITDKNNRRYGYPFTNSFSIFKNAFIDEYSEFSGGMYTHPNKRSLLNT
jgi:hypothetical protein